MERLSGRTGRTAGAGILCLAAALAGCGGSAGGPARVTGGSLPPITTVAGMATSNGPVGPGAAGRADPRPTTTVRPAGSWRLLPRSPLSAISRPVAVWTGSEMLVYGTDYSGGASLTRLAAYRPATGAWRLLASPPARGEVEGIATVVWTGRELLV
jgi:hypothetical protein